MVSAFVRQVHSVYREGCNQKELPDICDVLTREAVLWAYLTIIVDDVEWYPQLVLDQKSSVKPEMDTADL